MTTGTSSGGTAARSRWHGSRLWRRIVLLVVAVLVVGIAVVAVEAWRAYSSLREARADVTALKQQVGRGDLVDAQKTSTRLSVHARSARRASDGWLWDVAVRTPVVGADVEAVRVLARSVDDLAGAPVHDALVVLSRVQDGQLVPKDGRVDLDEYQRAAPLVSRFATEVSRSRERVDAVSPTDLVGPLGRAVSQFQEQLATADRAARASRTAIELVPALMGARGPRSILLVVQNNAEVRATGGMPGSFSVITTSHGRLQLGPHYSTSDLRPLRRPAATLTADERRLFGPTPASDVRDTTLTPDFPRAAQLLGAIVGRETGHRVDAVVSVDPVALSRVLRATGPLRAGTERFTAENVVTKLLHEPYQRFDTQARQNAYFSLAARAITTAMLTGQGDPENLVRQLAASVAQRRVAVWSSEPEEQRLLAGTAAAGALPQEVHGAPHVGMYLNDAAGGKLEYYLRTQGAVSSVSCSGGAQSVRVRFEMRSVVPPQARGLSHWVTGPSEDTRDGTMKLNLRIYAPAGGRLTGLDVDGRRASVTPGRQEDRPVSILPVALDPGQRSEVVATFDGPRGATDDPVLDWTPSILWQPPTATTASSC